MDENEKQKPQLSARDQEYIRLINGGPVKLGWAMPIGMAIFWLTISIIATVLTGFAGCAVFGILSASFCIWFGWYRNHNPEGANKIAVGAAIGLAGIALYQIVKRMKD